MRHPLNHTDAYNLDGVLKALIHDLPDIVAILDTEGYVVYLNPAGERAWAPLEQTTERPHLTDLFPERMVGRIRQEGLPTASARGSWQGFGAFRAGGGEERPAHLWLRRHTDGNGRIGHFSALLREGNPPPEANDPDGPDGAADALPAALKNKLAIPQGQDQLILDTDEIVFLTAEGHYTWIHGTEHNHLTSRTLGQLEAVLDPNHFFRTHRSHIVNLAFLRAIERVDNQHRVRLKGPENPGVPVSRNRLQRLRTFIGLG